MSNFYRRFIGVLGRESHTLGNFAPPEAHNRTNRRARHHLQDVHNNYSLAPEHIAQHVDIGHVDLNMESACVDIRQSPKTDVLVDITYDNLANSYSYLDNIV